eukprot:m.79646 g.79646  ORF g.79646 m.79646 type:complete len:1116 (+) comp14633_c0_seq2:45-3392(+)
MDPSPGLQRQASHQDHALQDYFPEEKARVEHDLYAALRTEDQQPHQGRVLLTSNALYFLPQCGSNRFKVPWTDVKDITDKSDFITTFIIKTDKAEFCFTNFISQRAAIKNVLCHFWRGDALQDEDASLGRASSLQADSRAMSSAFAFLASGSGASNTSSALSRGFSAPVAPLSTFTFGTPAAQGDGASGSAAPFTLSAAATPFVLPVQPQQQGQDQGQGQQQPELQAQPKSAASRLVSAVAAAAGPFGAFFGATPAASANSGSDAGATSRKNSDDDDFLARAIEGMSMTDNAETDAQPPPSVGTCEFCSATFRTKEDAAIHIFASPACRPHRRDTIFGGISSSDESENEDKEEETPGTDGGDDGGAAALFGGRHRAAARRPHRYGRTLPASLGDACPYFLAGHCRDGDDCEMSHGEGRHGDVLQSLMRTDSEEPDAPRRGIKAKVRAYQATTVCKPEIRCGDKIILHQNILHAALAQEGAFPWPLSFQLCNPTNNKVIHAGVLDFTAPDVGTAFVPDWMLNHLEAIDGDVVRVRAVRLPKGVACQLQPLDASWMDIPRDHRADILEFQLRGFQTLTEGSVITIDNERREYPFLVVQCAPEPGISIIDCDIATDILPPAEDCPSEHTNLVLGQAVESSSEAGKTKLFVVRAEKGKELPSVITVEVTASKGDPDLFVSQTERRPGRQSYLSCAQAIGSVTVTVGKHVPGWMPWAQGNCTCLYLAVCSMLDDTEFTLCARAATDKDSRQPVVSGLFVDQQPEQPEPKAGEVVCKLCSHCVPSARLVMHERHCARHMWRCEICDLALPSNQRAKHEAVAHDTLMCTCTVELTQLELHKHQQTMCPHRLVPCSNPWCSMVVPSGSLTQHAMDCAMRQTPCVLCFQEVRWRELEGHLFAMHNVETSTIDWAKPLVEQTLTYNEPAQGHAPDPLLCRCGFRAINTEGIQLHMLTECARREENIAELATRAEEEAAKKQAEAEARAIVTEAEGEAKAAVEPLPAHGVDEWACPNCTFINPVLLPKCEMCRGPQPRRVQTPSPEWPTFASAASSAAVSPSPASEAGTRAFVFPTPSRAEEEKEEEEGEQIREGREQMESGSGDGAGTDDEDDVLLAEVGADVQS